MEQPISSEFVIQVDGSFICMHSSCYSHENLQCSILRNMYDGEDSLRDVSLYGVPPSDVSGTSLSSVRAHKCVLIHASKHLSDLLTSENYTDSHQPGYHIKNVDHESLRRIVEYMYTGRLKVTVENAVDEMCGIFIGADYLLMKVLASKCESFLAAEDQIKPKSCVKLWCFARKYSCLKLMHATSTFMAKHVSEVSKNTVFLHMPYADCAKLFLSEAMVETDANERCLAAISWLEFDSVGRASFVSDILNMIPLAVGSVSIGTIHEALECEMLWEHAPDTMKQLSRAVAKRLKLSEPAACGETSLSVPHSSLYVLDCPAESKQFWEYDNIRRVWSELPDFSWNSIRFSACSVGDKLFAVGGYEEFGTRNFRDIHEYDTRTKSWSTETNKLTVARHDVSTCSDGRRRLYALGGKVNDNDVDIVEMYDCHSKQITKLASMRTKRSTLAAICTVNNTGFNNHFIYVAGGADSDEQDRIEKYDISNNKWSEVGRMVTGNRYGLASALVGDDLYLIGGRKMSKKSSTNAVEIFNIRTGQSCLTQNLLAKREGCSATTLYHGNLVCVFGGYDLARDKELCGVECLDTREGKWSTGTVIPDMPSAACYFGFATF